MYSESLDLCDAPYPYALYRLAGKASETKCVCNPNLQKISLTNSSSQIVPEQF